MQPARGSAGNIRRIRRASLVKHIRTRTMSEQSARPAAPASVGAKLENLYKPVGIAALTAAAMFLRPLTQKTAGK